MEVAPGARLGSCWEVETVPKVTRELHGLPSARRPPLVPCHSAQGPVPGKDAGDGDWHRQELAAPGFPTALSGARSSWMSPAGEENLRQVRVRLPAEAGMVLPTAEYMLGVGGGHAGGPGMPTSLSQLGLYLCLVPAGGCACSLDSGGGPGESPAPCHQGIRGTQSCLRCARWLGVLQSVHVGRDAQHRHGTEEAAPCSCVRSAVAKLVLCSHWRDANQVDTAATSAGRRGL